MNSRYFLEKWKGHFFLRNWAIFLGLIKEKGRMLQDAYVQHYHKALDNKNSLRHHITLCEKWKFHVSFEIIWNHRRCNEKALIIRALQKVTFIIHNYEPKSQQSRWNLMEAKLRILLSILNALIILYIMC